MASKALAPDVLFEHVQDAPYFHLPRWFAPEHDGHLMLPQPLAKFKLDAAGHVVTDHHGMPTYEPLWAPNTGMEFLDSVIEPLELMLTKFMVLELVAAIGMVVVFGLLALKLKGGAAPRGILPNLVETMLLFIRDKVARPAIGHDADKFLPFLWTMFFFVLSCNLLGMIPWLGSPTGALATTGALAFLTFAIVVSSGISQFGVVGFLKAQVPHMDLPKPIAVFLLPMVFLIEIFGLFVKHFVLAVRLLANMMAGHVVLAVIVGFIGATAGMLIWYAVTPASIMGAVLLSMLELFVAFLQAYIFTFLSALFIGAAVHSH
ncbi:MAG: F0F1 ATP synthase subunit A [Pirellulales bacterium]